MAGTEVSFTVSVDTLDQGTPGQPGTPGTPGTPGASGRSAYDLAVLAGYPGTLNEWLASLIGTPGTNGTNGTNGPSAYEIAVANGYSGTQQQWLASLVGQVGATGASAYQDAVINGFSGTVQQWLTSLVGPAGPSAADGSITDAKIAAPGLAQSSIVGLTTALTARRSLAYFRSGLYHPTVLTTAALSSSNALGIGNLRLAPFLVPAAMTLTRLVSDIATVGDSGSRLRIGIYADDGNGYPGALVFDQGLTPFTDGVTNSTTTLTSATAGFTSADTGRSVTGSGIPGGTTATYVNATTITLSNAATATATNVTFTIDRSANGASATVQESVLSLALAPGLYWIGAAVQNVTTTQPTVRTIVNAVFASGTPTLPSAGSVAFGYSQASVTGALPSPFTSTVTTAGATPRIWVKVA